jgi:hypothetical protein
MNEAGTNMKKFVGAAIGFLGGGIASLITVGLIVSIFEIKYQSVLPGALFGASISGLTGFFFPRLGEKLIDFFWITPWTST